MSELTTGDVLASSVGGIPMVYRVILRATASATSNDSTMRQMSIRAQC